MSWTAETLEAACRTLIPRYDPWAGADAYYFDHAAALRAVHFIEECCTFTNSRWAGTRFLLQGWQAATVGLLFGFKRRTDHLRRYRRCLIFTARKSGKTELAGAIANYLLHCDNEPSPEIIAAAGNAEQAEKVFRAASQMALNEPELARRSKVFKRAIESTVNGGSIKVINSESRTKHGGNTHAALIDELHVHRDADLVDVIETGMRSRQQPLSIYTTTAGQSTESIAYETYDFACKVRDGVASDPEFLPVIFEVPADADVTDPAMWKLAQPNLGVTVDVAEYERDLLKAQQIPRFMHTFRQLSLNQWVEAASAWIGIDAWKACAGAVDIESLKGCRAALGLDLSSTTDTTAIVAAVEVEDRIIVVPFIFIPKDSVDALIKRQKRDRAPVRSWVEQKLITATDGAVVDYSVVEAKVLELCKHLNVIEVQADPYNATGTLERLQKEGLPVVTVRQGWSLAEATKETERLILSKKLLHGNHAALNWQLSCASCKTDEHDNQWVVKSRSTGRVDAVVAMVMAINGLKFGAGAGAPTTHYYEEHPELIVL